MVTNSARSTQPCIPLESLNRVPALTGWDKGGNVTSAGWQVTLYDLVWHVSSHGGESGPIYSTEIYTVFLGRVRS